MIDSLAPRLAHIGLPAPPVVSITLVSQAIESVPAPSPAAPARQADQFTILCSGGQRVSAPTTNYACNARLRQECKEARGYEVEHACESTAGEQDNVNATLLLSSHRAHVHRPVTELMYIVQLQGTTAVQSQSVCTMQT